MRRPSGGPRAWGAATWAIAGALALLMVIGGSYSAQQRARAPSQRGAVVPLKSTMLVDASSREDPRVIDSRAELRELADSEWLYHMYARQVDFDRERLFLFRGDSGLEEINFLTRRDGGRLQVTFYPRTRRYFVPHRPTLHRPTAFAFRVPRGADWAVAAPRALY